MFRNMIRDSTAGIPLRDSGYSKARYATVETGRTGGPPLILPTFSRGYGGRSGESVTQFDTGARILRY